MLRLPVDDAGGLHGAGHGSENLPKDDSQAGIVTTDIFAKDMHSSVYSVGDRQRNGFGERVQGVEGGYPDKAIRLLVMK